MNIPPNITIELTRTRDGLWRATAEAGGVKYTSETYNRAVRAAEVALGQLMDYLRPWQASCLDPDKMHGACDGFPGSDF